MGIGSQPRLASPDDALDVARLLDQFNHEYGTPSPGVETLTERLRVLLAEESTFALVAGRPPVGVALVTLRPNVWFRGPVALLDELFVEPGHRGEGMDTSMMGLLISECRRRGVELIEVNVDEGDVDARRFYQRHGFSETDPGSAERGLYYWRELD